MSKAEPGKGPVGPVTGPAPESTESMKIALIMEKFR